MGTTLNGSAFFETWPASFRNEFSTSGTTQLLSVNNPQNVIIGVHHNDEGMDYTPTNEGDIVNVIFKVYAKWDYNFTSMYNSAHLVATVRKPMDIPFEFGSKNYIGTLTPTEMADGSMNTKYFTINLAPFIRPLLSYSLIPCGRGALGGHAPEWLSLAGGLNGNYGDTIIGGLNGGMVHVALRCSFEVLDANGLLTVATTTTGSSSIKYIDQYTKKDGLHGYPIQFINSVEQWGDAQNLTNYNMRSGYTSDRNTAFLSRCPNNDTSSTWLAPRYLKSARVDEHSDFVYFMLYEVKPSTWNTACSGALTYSSTTFKLYIRVEMYNFDTTTESKFLDTEDDAFWYSAGYNNTSLTAPTDEGGNFVGCRRWTKMWLGQNVSPDYINNNAGSGTGTIDANTEFYRISVQWMDNENGFCDGAAGATGCQCVNNGGSWGGNTYRVSEYRYFKMDHSGECPFGNVRFHWLNSLGGIDSYTCTKNQSEQLTKSFSTYERKPTDPMWLNDNNSMGFWDFQDMPFNPTMRSYNTNIRSEQYQTSVEVMDVQALKKGVVFTAPLNIPDAKWLEEIFTSPNVWIEVDNDRGARAENANPMAHPSEDDYSPVVITNSEVITLDTDQKLVQYSIEYQHGHYQNTQGN